MKFYLLSRYAKVYAFIANRGSESLTSVFVPPSTRSNPSQQDTSHGSKYANKG